MDEMPYSFTTAHTPGLAEVGGKASSLIAMTHAGLPVPAGFVLPTGFFQPWLDGLRATAQWRAFMEALGADESSDENLHEHAADLQAACTGLSLTKVQHRQLSRALADLRELGRDSGPELLAVRSSAPQEDLAGASFAGVYDSVLAVPPGELTQAIRKVFTSGLGFKAVSYKRQRGFDPSRVELAVVVQRQVESVSAGVAFSVNPQTNDYDGTAIQANWGMGETVVSGSVTPDQFTVDKLSGRIVEKKPGAKETALWSRPESAFVAASAGRLDNGQELSLTDTQAVEISAMVSRVEALMDVPVDVEWAYDPDGDLHLLQARPVTTYFPLPDELRTAPGEPRRLYADSTLLEEGLQQPLSVLGSQWMADAIAEMARQLTGRRAQTDTNDGFVRAVAGRWYANVSNLLWLGQERLALSLETLDFHAAAVVRNIDVDHYKKAARRPAAASITGLALATVVHSAGPVGKALVALVTPDHGRRRYTAAVDRHRKQLAEVARSARSVPELGERTLRPATHLLIRESLPLTCAAEIATALLRLLYRRAPRPQRRRLEAALRAMPDNITIDMGLALYDLARAAQESLGEHAYADLSAVARRIDTRDLPKELLREWDAFMDAYGFRGPAELDLASARYTDDPMLILEQMRQYGLLDEQTEETPKQAYERRQRARRDAYNALLEGTRNPLKARLVTRLYRATEAFSGLREIHKYYLVMAGYQVRRRALALGRDLADRGRLDSAEQIFDLSYEDLRGGDAAELDLRARGDSNTSYRRKLARIPGARFPVIVDSRGNIPRPASRTAIPGVSHGEGVSPGMARGPAKVLSHVGEKPVLPGEVLVARATDPGWTPLFVNAAGIVLETGGSFQHGALVAREYGKPCVVAVENATERLTDGQVVELDGAAGTMTLVSDPPDTTDNHAALESGRSKNDAGAG